MSENQPLAEALRAEILKLASDGDAKNEGALTDDVLLRIMRVAKTGRDLLVALNAKASHLANMLRPPKQGSGFLSSVGGNIIEDDSLADGFVTNQFPYAPSSPSENFGMTAIREIIAAAKNLNGGTSPEKLVAALVIAREKGLHDVAQELEAQLGMQKKPLVVEVPKSADGNGA